MNKILVLSSYPAPYRIDVFRGLAKKYEIDVFFATDKDQNRSKDFFVKQSEFRYYVMEDEEAKQRFKTCVKHIKQYSLVLAYDWYLGFALKVEAICIANKVPYILNCDGAFIGNSDSLISKVKDLVKSIFIKNATLCFSSGEYATKYFIHYGAAQERIREHKFTSLYATDISEHPTTQEDKKKLRKELGLSDLFCVVTVGQFIERKGFDVLLKAWQLMDKQAQLVLIGGGMLENQYKKIISASGYINVEIIQFIPKDKVMAYLKAADLFVLPTREDIWGLVINEAMAVGTPVISSNRCVAGLQMLKEGLGGEIVPVDDPKALGKAMYGYMQLDDTQKAEKQREAIYVAKDYTIENIILQHIKEIDALIDRCGVKEND